MIAPRHARRLRRGGAAFAAAAAVVGASMIFASVGASDGERPAIDGLPAGYGIALYVPTEAEGEAEPAWTQLAAAIELVRSSRENLAQAESLRGTAARLAQISRENVQARKAGESDPAALESARYQQFIAESQLALAEELLAKARKMSESAVGIFEIARQNALQRQDGHESQEPNDFVRPEPPDVVRSVRLLGAARRSRHA